MMMIVTVCFGALMIVDGRGLWTLAESHIAWGSRRFIVHHMNALS